MENIMQIINLSKSIDNDDIVILCDKLIGNLNESDEQLLTFMEKSDIEDLINISQVPSSYIV